MDDAIRLSLWGAFSDFFLDTELTDQDFQHAARVVAASGLQLEQAEAVLWNEVFPVLHQNFLDPSGIWAGWPEDWLKANLRPSTGPARRVGPELAVKEIGECWGRMVSHLPRQHT